MRTVTGSRGGTGTLRSGGRTHSRATSCGGRQRRAWRGDSALAVRVTGAKCLPAAPTRRRHEALVTHARPQAVRVDGRCGIERQSGTPRAPLPPVGEQAHRHGPLTPFAGPPRRSRPTIPGCDALAQCARASVRACAARSRPLRAAGHRAARRAHDPRARRMGSRSPVAPRLVSRQRVSPFGPGLPEASGTLRPATDVVASRAKRGLRWPLAPGGSPRAAGWVASPSARAARAHRALTTARAARAVTSGGQSRQKPPR